MKLEITALPYSIKLGDRYTKSTKNLHNFLHKLNVIQMTYYGKPILGWAT